MKVDQTQDFVDGFFKQLQNMQKQKYLTDFKLRVFDDELTCHKVVLSARSDYFQALFDHPDTLEVRQGFVEFQTFQFPVLQRVVDYCYSGTLEFETEDAKHLIEVAEHLQIHDLTAAISALVLPCLTIDNCINWYAFANMFRLSTLKEKAHEIMLVDFTRVANAPEFFAMEYEHVTEYISWDDVDVNSALIAAAKWVIHDISKRKDLFPDIVKTIDINRCSRNALKHVMDTYGTQLITDFDMSQKFTTAALSDVGEWQEPGRGAGLNALVLGGYSSDSTNTKTWMINLKTGVIVDKTEFPSTFCKVFIPAVCGTSKGAVFAGGALTSTSTSYFDPQNQCTLYLKHEDAWALLPEAPEGMMGSCAVCVEDTKVYVVGGLDSHREKMHCLDLTEKTWSTCPNLLQGLEWPVVGCVGRCIYVIFSTWYKNKAQGKGITLQCFSTITSSWSWKSSLPNGTIGTHGASTVTIGHQLYVIGGSGSICLSYDSTNDTWTSLTPPSLRHHHGAGMFFKNRIILCGGQNYDGKESDIIESYDVATDKWKVLPITLPKPLWTHCIIPCS